MCDAIPWWQIVLEVMTAFGTVGATVTAVVLALRENDHKIDSVFLWGGPTQYKPILMIQNRGSRIVVISKVKILYDGKQISDISFLDGFSLCKKAIIKGGEIQEVVIDPKYLKSNKPKNVNKRRKLTIIVEPRQGRRYRSCQKYSYNELCGLFFGYGLFNN